MKRERDVLQDETRTSARPEPTAEAVERAARAGLTYVSDQEPGLTRKPWGRGFTYLDEHGRRIQDGPVRERIKSLVIPPAWTDVWISADPDGHIQATGRDADGRKQYIYHPEWERARDEIKFDRITAFGRSLDALRRHCRRAIAARKLSREKVLPAVVFLLDKTLIRIGNESYARRNDSFGLTTLRDRHVDFSGTTCTFEFPGKSGKQHRIELNDPRLARIVRQCRDVPGQELFQYYGEDGERRQVRSTDVNEYLKSITGEAFTAKDFRTWGSSVHAASHLNALAEPKNDKEANSQIVQVMKMVADELGNTPAVCRDYYIHPHIMEAHREGTFQALFRRELRRSRDGYLDRRERALLRFLDAWQADGISERSSDR